MNIIAVMMNYGGSNATITHVAGINIFSICLLLEHIKLKIDVIIAEF